MRRTASPPLRRRVPAFLRLIPIIAVGMSSCGQAPAQSAEHPPPPVHVLQLKLERVVPQTDASAEILPKRRVTLHAEVAGRITEVHVDRGQKIFAGDRILRLDVSRTASATRAAQASVSESNARVAQAARELKRTRALVDAGGLPSQRLDDARHALAIARAAQAAAKAQRNLSSQGFAEAVIKAPFDGTIVDRFVELGEFVTPGMPIAELADTSRLEARVMLDPDLSLQIKPGSPVALSVSARPDEIFEARVLRIGDVVDPRTRRLPVEVGIHDPGHRLRPGLVGRFSVQVGAPKDAILVPPRAIIERFETHYVYALADDVALRKPVELGPTRHGLVEIVEGLDGTETIVVEGAARVVEGSPVKVVPKDTP